MKRGIRIISIVFAAILLTGCPSKGGSQYGYSDFKNHTEYGVYYGHNKSVTFSKSQYEIGFIRSLREFRIQDDNQNVIVRTTLSADPQLRASLTLTLTGTSSAPSGTYRVMVMSLSGDRVWLWSEERRTGFILYWE